MKKSTSPSRLAQPFCPVKPSIPSIPSIPSNPMIHHKSRISRNKKLIVSYGRYREERYGVSRSHRLLSPGLFIKRFDNIRDCLEHVIGLTVAQREVALRLLRLWAYYGHVYPKESQVTELPGCSKATYWRTVKLLKELSLVTVVNRYVIRPHAQISNLYRLDRLVLLLARYLAEHGSHFWEKWLRPVLAMPGQQFWSQIFLTPGERVVPWRLAFGDL